MISSLAWCYSLTIVSSLLLPSAWQVIKLLKRVRRRTVHSEKMVSNDLLNLETRLIRNIVRRRLFFIKTPKDLVQLVTFCGHDEFYGQEILSSVLVHVFSSHRDFCKCYHMCAPILETPLTVRHYLSTCNREKIRIGCSRFTDFLLNWLLTLLRVRVMLLGLMEPKILQEILKRGTKDVYGEMFFELRYWEEKNDEGVSPYLLADLMYLCLFALYVNEVRKNEPVTADHSKTTVNILSCISLVFRAVPRMPMALVQARGQVLLQRSDTRIILNKTVGWLNNCSALPTLQERMGTQVPSLKHLSRCKIRSVLYDNWALPEGIGELDLPQYLHRYINLYYD